MGISLPGLASGLDSASLIKSLMQLEAIPQALLQRKASVAASTVTVLQALNSRVAGLAEAAGTAGKPAALDLHKATSSSDVATVTASKGASAGSLDLVVKQLAQAQSNVTAGMSAWSEPPVVTIVGADGTATELTAASSSLDDVVKAVNNSDAGVRAMKVASGVDGNGDAVYRLQFTGTETGADAAFSIFQGTEAEFTAGTAPNMLTAPGSAQLTAARNAEVALWAGTGAEQLITSKTNTFDALLPGVAVTVVKESTDPVTIKVARDTAGATALVKGLVSSISETLAFIDVRTKVVNSKDAAGNPIVSGGSLTGDSTVRSGRQSILSAASMPLNGESPSEFGITLTKSGTIEFNEAVFSAALAADPAKVEAAITSLANRVAAAATTISDKYTGTLTAKITGQESLVKNLNTQAESWDQRLEKRQATLERTYSALEVRMSALNSQSTWLSSQLSSLPTYGGNKK
jgi:flagellar hook-associated protein 2